MPDNEKIDLFKQHKTEYKATSKPAIIETTAAPYLAIEGQGIPGGPEFEDRVGALYGMAFTIKMTRKAAGLGDYVVCKLESLWYAPDGSDDLCSVPREKWCWTLMIRTPDCVQQADLDKAVKALLGKGKCESVRDVKLQTMDEGQCVQMLHVGPYDQVGETNASKCSTSAPTIRLVKPSKRCSHLLRSRDRPSPANTTRSTCPTPVASPPKI
jgi:hypothetical protein